MSAQPEKTGQEAVASSELLECGHPGAPNNLIRGRCGTCKQVTILERLAKSQKGKAKWACLELAKLFRRGDVFYDTNGKTLVEWEKTLPPHSNDKLCDPARPR